MKRLLFPALALSLMPSVAQSEPVRLMEAQLDTVTAAGLAEIDLSRIFDDAIRGVDLIVIDVDGLRHLLEEVDDAVRDAIASGRAVVYSVSAVSEHGTVQTDQVFIRRFQHISTSPQ